MFSGPACNLHTVSPGVVFAPVCWSSDHYNGIAPYDDWYAGNWRSSGTGMVSFYVSDFMDAGGCVPLADRAAYGKEDHEFSMMMKRKGTVRLQRACTPELWHLFHSKASWAMSADGMRHQPGQTAAPANGTDDWKLALPRADGPQVLQSRPAYSLNSHKCRFLLTHAYA